MKQPLLLQPPAALAQAKPLPYADSMLRYVASPSDVSHSIRRKAPDLALAVLLNGRFAPCSLTAAFISLVSVRVYRTKTSWEASSPQDPEVKKPQEHEPRESKPRA